MSSKKTWAKLVGHLKKFAPAILEGAAGVAGTAAGGPALGAVFAAAARKIAGKGADADLDEVAATIFGTPELQIELERIALEREKAYLNAEAARAQVDLKRQELVNLTMRGEAQADDPYVRRWRPTFGYIAGAAFGGQIFGVAWVMISGGDPELITALQSLTFLWAPAMAVLGITSWTRGEEKVERIKGRP